MALAARRTGAISGWSGRVYDDEQVRMSVGEEVKMMKMMKKMMMMMKMMRVGKGRCQVDGDGNPKSGIHVGKIRHQRGCSRPVQATSSTMMPSI
jgi:hypothetical protein